MKIRTYGQHLIQLTQTFPFPINCYLVPEEDGLTLIDTGFYRNDKNILEVAKSQNAPIKRIILTHSHSDHVASLDALRDSLPEAEVLISHREARFLAGDTSLLPSEPPQKSLGSHMTCKTKPTRLLEEGDTVGSLEVIATPGHTPGQIALLDTRDRTLIAGDALQVQGGVAVSGTLKPFFPFPAWATWSKELALQSAKKLLTLQPSRLAVGHGRVLEEPLEVMQIAIAEAERSLTSSSRTRSSSLLPHKTQHLMDDHR
jgi:glyoxylase-like metal-dependent hydrolase (beta-lactamase superfamily II)